MEVNEHTRETTFVPPKEKESLLHFLVALRFLCMLGFYGGAIGVIYSIFVFESPKGPEATLPVSPAVQCVVNLTCQFFFVYFMMTVMLTVSEVSGGQYPLDTWKLFSAIEAAKSTL